MKDIFSITQEALKKKLALRSNYMPEHTGKKVQVSGVYVCVPCGYKKSFSAGDTFPTCIACLGKDITQTNDFGDLEADGEPIAADLETWELLKEIERGGDSV